MEAGGANQRGHGCLHPGRGALGAWYQTPAAQDDFQRLPTVCLERGGKQQGASADLK